MKKNYTLLNFSLLFVFIGNVWAEDKCICSTKATELKLGEQPLIVTSERSQLPLYDIILHSGEKTDLSAFRGKCVVVSFAYTTCSNPNKCAAVTQNMGKLQEKLKSFDQSDDVVQLLLSYDARYDSLEAMKKYAGKHSYKLGKRAYYAKPDQKIADKFFESFGAKVSFNSSGVSLHDIHALVLDREGRMAKVYTKLLWDNERIIDQLKTILKEPYEVLAED